MLRFTTFIYPILFIGLIHSLSIQAQNIQQIAREGTQDMEAAYNRGDLMGVANIYADDACLLGPNNYMISGRKNIDEYWTQDYFSGKMETQGDPGQR